MELKEFLEKFLPEYERKREEARLREYKVGVIQALAIDYFSEAIQNYTDLICEKQRKNCGQAWGSAPFEKESFYIKNAEQPKIEEL